MAGLAGRAVGLRPAFELTRTVPPVYMRMERRRLSQHLKQPRRPLTSAHKELIRLLAEQAVEAFEAEKDEAESEVSDER